MSHNIYWLDLPLLIVLVSLVYSATRSDEWGVIWREAFRWMLRLTAFLGTIGLVLFLINWLGATGVTIVASVGIVVVVMILMSKV